MVNHANGIGYFTAENIAAVLRALPETDGTCEEVIKQAREYDGDVSKHTLGKSVSSECAKMRGT